MFLREAPQRIAGLLRPTAAADEHDGRARGAEQLRELRHFGRPRRGFDQRERRCIGHRDTLDQHVLGNADHDRSRPAVDRGVERARNDLRHPRRIVDFRRPFGHRAEHGAVVEFLERLALAHVARDLADEHDQRRRILMRDVDAMRRIGRARAAGDETHAGPACHFADRLGHHAGAALLPANGDGEIAVMESVEHRQVALARHAEHVTHAVNLQLIDQDLGGGPHVVLDAHRVLLALPHGMNSPCWGRPGTRLRRRWQSDRRRDLSASD